MNFEIINTRRNNKIYTNGIDTYKVFNENYDKRLVFLESFITTEVEAAGVKVPSIKEVTFNDNHWCFKSDSIKGDTLFSLIKNDPDNVDKYLDKMVEVHTSIHKFKCPKLPIQKDKLTDYIKLSDLDEGMKIDLLDMLNTCPKHNKLVHGNFTPHNVLVSDYGDYVLDWNHAAQGSGQWYSDMGSGYGYERSAGDLGKWCCECMAINAICNCCCCGGRGFFCC